MSELLADGLHAYPNAHGDKSKYNVLPLTILGAIVIAYLAMYWMHDKALQIVTSKLCYTPLKHPHMHTAVYISCFYSFP